MTSRRSETSSPISTFCLPACSGRSSGSITTSIRSRCGGKPLRGRGERLPSDGRGLLTCALSAAMPVSISSKTKARCAAASAEAAIAAELFRSPAKPGPVIGLEDLHEGADPLLGIGSAGFQLRELALQSLRARGLRGRRTHHGFQQIHVIGKREIIGVHHTGIKACFRRSCALFLVRTGPPIHFAAG